MFQYQNNVHPAGVTDTVKRSRPYASHSIPQLIRAVTDQNDETALNEFHTYRRIFSVTSRERLIFVDFLRHLYETWEGVREVMGGTWIFDAAYNMTLDRFARLPTSRTHNGQASRTGIDCRHYFSAFLRRLEREVGSNGKWGSLAVHNRACQLLQNHVVHHFHLSLLEARRTNNCRWTRYAWQVDGHTLNLRMPTYLRGQERRKWLEDHIQSVNPTREGETVRIQSIIDTAIGDHDIIQAVDFDLLNHVARERDDNPATAQETDTENRLAQAVADLKVIELDTLRPSIRRLGASRVRALVLRIFSAIEEDSYLEKAIASSFGLSRSTLSRFAGSNWQSRQGSQIPDLWANTAIILSQDEQFAAAAKSAGVWSRANQILQSKPDTEGRLV